MTSIEIDSLRDIRSNVSKRGAVPTGTYRQADAPYRFGLTLMYLALSFDINRSFFEEPLSIEVTIYSLYFLGFLVAFFSNQITQQQSINFGILHRYIFLWVAFTIYLPIIAIFRGEQQNSLIPNGLMYAMVPYLVMLLSIVTFFRHLRANYDPKDFYNLFFALTFIATIWTFYLGRIGSENFYRGDFSFVEDIRYEILSSALPGLLGMSVYFISRRQYMIRSILALVSALIIILFSKTRGVMLGAVSIIPIVILLSDRRLRSLIIMAVGVVLTYFIITEVVSNLLYFDIFEVWQTRLTIDEDLNFDLTTLTRLAESLEQLNVLFSSFSSAIFGYGPVYSTYYDASIVDLFVTSGVDFDYYATDLVGAHSTWINTLFQGGLLVGWIPAFNIGIVVVIFIRISFMKRSERASYPEMGRFWLMLVMPYILPSFTGNVFVQHVGPVVLGTACAGAIYEWIIWRQNRKSASTLQTESISEQF